MAKYRHLEVTKRGEVYVARFADARLRNELLIENVGHELLEVAEVPNCRHLLLNLDGVTKMASAMLGTLVKLQKRMQAKDGKLILCEIGPGVQEVLDVTGLDEYFQVRDTETKGVMAFYA